MSAVLEKLGEMGLGLPSRRVLAFVDSGPGFSQQQVVVDGASSFLLSLFGDRGARARSSVGVAGLLFNIPVEVEMIVEVEG